MRPAMTTSAFAAARLRLRTRPARGARPIVLAVLGLACFTPATSAAPPLTAANWDLAQQRQVSAAGLMSNVGDSFAGASHLSAAQADAAMAALAERLAGPTGEQGAPGEDASATGSATATSVPAVNPVRTAQSPVTVVTFDRIVIEQLGLGDVAAHVQSVAQAAGLRPPSYLGSEVVARFLELRYDHPAGTDRLELFPTDPITRAEAAWSLARVLHFGSWNVAYAREALLAFELPRMSADQRQALQIAVSRIGYPYVWGGTTDNTADGLEHGGFDCSGFVWRVFKVSGLSWGAQILGRTAAEQAGEIPRSQRLRASQLEPGDLLFFGSAHFTSKATERNVTHEGIYMGDNWVINSSSQGVYVLPLKGSWLGSSFAWGRRVIP